MQLSTRSRYGTRLMVDLAQHYDQGPIRINDIAKRQDISVKYLEQLIIPLKKADLIKSVRGPKGGHLLAKPTQNITVGEIVMLLENETSLAPCIKNPGACYMTDTCLTRDIWGMLTEKIYETLNSITLSD
ncbi:MAG: RrF2 family transcriptional regulator, partial [Deltaproteobacteria bacterium]|nr:RrF2 family transcriptional regulator [Deltaproteobacteria bacterium]